MASKVFKEGSIKNLTKVFFRSKGGDCMVCYKNFTAYRVNEKGLVVFDRFLS